MKINILSAFIIMLIILSGCQKDELSDSQSNSTKISLSPLELLYITYLDSPELDESEVFGLLNEFYSKKMQKDRISTRSTKIQSSKINRKYYLNEKNSSSDILKAGNLEVEEELIPVYEIDFSTEEGKGLAIISGDRRVPHVLAFVDKINEEDASLSAGPNALLEWATMCIYNEVVKFETIKDSLHTEIQSKISKGLKIDVQDISYNSIKELIAVDNSTLRSTPISDIPENLIVKGGTYPMCPVAWGQTQPYNCQLPMANCELYFPGWVEYTNYPAGVAVVSVAHIMACLEPALTLSGTTMNWAYLTENLEITAPDYFNPGDPLDKRNMVGYLFKEIYNKTKSTPVKNSQNVVTGSTAYLSDVEAYLKSVFNCDNSRSWNINTIRNSLSANRPVYTYGKAENNGTNGVYPFVIDGIMNCYGRINNVPRDIDLTYLHANFGFGGGWQDGYYLMELDHSTAIFETTIPLIFKSGALTIIPNIRKK